MIGRLILSVPGYTVRPCAHVSRYFWIRNFSFPYSNLPVYTYPTSINGFTLVPRTPLGILAKEDASRLPYSWQRTGLDLVTSPDKKNIRVWRRQGVDTISGFIAYSKISTLESGFKKLRISLQSNYRWEKAPKFHFVGYQTWKSDKPPNNLEGSTWQPEFLKKLLCREQIRSNSLSELTAQERNFSYKHWHDYVAQITAFIIQK